MPTSTIPSAGAITLSAIKAAFPGVSTWAKNNLSAYLGQHPALPSASAIRFGSFRGLTAVSPAHVLGAASGTNVTITAGGLISGTVGASQVGVLSYALKSYVANGAYQGTVTYAVGSGSLPTGVSLASDGTLTVSTSAPTSGSVPVTITATNKWGNTSTISLTFQFAAVAVAATTYLTASSYAGGSTWTTVDGTATYALFNKGTPGALGDVVFNGSSSTGTYAYLSSLPGIAAGASFPNGISVAVMYHRNGNTTSSGGEGSSGSFLCVNRDNSNWTFAMQAFENVLATYSSNATLRMLTPTTAISGTGFKFRAYTLTADGVTAKAYLNGRPDGTATLTGTTYKNNAICIGRNYRDNLNNLNGVIKAHAVYTSVLTDADILSIYNAWAPSVFSFVVTATTSSTATLTIYGTYTTVSIAWATAGGAAVGSTSGVSGATFTISGLSTLTAYTVTVTRYEGATAVQTASGNLTTN